MKHRNLKIITFLIIICYVIVSCTRSASGGPSEVKTDDSELPNPVSTQSQLMKDIISGTQTAMAAPLEGEDEAADEDAESDTTDETAAESTPEPEEEEEEIILPTSTAGPPPVAELEYNTKKCGPNIYLCTISYEKDQTVTIQATHPWLLNNMDLTFKMGPEGLYDTSKYIVVGTAKYEPDASKGYGFTTSLNIPDSLRGKDVIVVRLDTNNPEYFGTDYFNNQ